MLAIGAFLLIYAKWAAFGKVRISARHDNPVSSSLVGVCGAIVGGVCGFPGSAMVVWNGLITRGKAGRAYTQSFVLLSQVIAIAYLSTAHSSGGHTSALLFVFAPVALIANTVSVKLYKSASADRYKAVTLAALGISGLVPH
jgi:undecaprenyl pyrophosphate phosphatase UppP